MPPSRPGFIWRATHRCQDCLSLLAVAVALLNVVPLEPQRLRSEPEPIGTVVAFVAGLDSINDPWDDLVNWFQDVMVNRIRCRTFRAGTQQFAESATAPT
jgi:hypothetical protein